MARERKTKDLPSENSATARGTAAEGSITIFIRSHTSFVARLEGRRQKHYGGKTGGGTNMICSSETV